MSSLRDLYEPLATPRLLLREPRAEHAPQIFGSFSSDPEVTRFLRWRPHRELAEAEAAMAGRLARLRDASELSWIAFLRATDHVVGSVSLWPSPPQAELGFAFARAVWGRGLASEAARAVLDWAFRRLPLERIWAACDVENARSRRVLEKLGMAQERVAPAFAVHPGLGAAPRDCFIHAVARPAP
jgi:RimJ/RimL family protein N-acetyltransferase